MAETSGFWDDGVGGDETGTVWSSPYNAAERADWFSKLMAGDGAQGYVIPGYANNLAPTISNLVVSVNTGAAFVRGRLYENTASKTVTLDAADGTNPRIDRVVLEITFATAQVRLNKVTGTPAASPAIPTLTQNATTYQLEVAQVYVAASASAGLLWEKRIFGMPWNAAHQNQPNNLLMNSEWLAADGTNNPPGWTGTAAAFTLTTKPSQMSRGRALQIQVNNPNTFSQVIPCQPSTTYVLRALVSPGGNAGTFSIFANGTGTPTALLDLRTISGVTYQDVYLYVTTAADSTTLTIRLSSAGSNITCTLGQIIVVEGYVPGPYRPISEVIPLNVPITDSNWATTAKSTANTVIDLSTDFGGKVLLYTRGLILRIEGNDSGSAAGAAKLDVRYSTGSNVIARLQLDGVTNDKVRSQQVTIGLLNNERKFNLDVTATGAGTFDATVTIVAILT